MTPSTSVATHRPNTGARLADLRWLEPILLAAIVGIVYTQLPSRSIWSALTYDGFISYAVVRIMHRSHTMRGTWTRHWRYIAAGMICYIGGDIAWYTIQAVTGAAPGGASIADVGYLAFAPLVAAGFLSLLRHRGKGRDAAGLIDALILTVGAGLLVWVLLIVPNATSEGSALSRIVATAYPLTDLLLLAVGARLVTRGGTRPASYFLLLGAITVNLAADIRYGLESLDDTYQAGGWLDVAYLLAHALLVAAALHPHATELTEAQAEEQQTVGLVRVAGLAVAVCIGPAVAALADTPSARVLALVASVVMFVLVLGRLTMMNVAVRHAEARFASLVRNAADAIVVIDHTGHQLYTSPALDGIVGQTVSATDAANLFDWVDQHDHEAIRQSVQALASTDDGRSITMSAKAMHSDGGWRFLEMHATNRLTDPAVGGLVLNIRDQTERMVLEDQLRHEAFHDPLTGLPNRALFADRLSHALAGLGRGHHVLALLYCDLDGFKAINDTFGHDAGDHLLTEVARRLVDCVRPEDTVARLGGDEFAVVLTPLNSLETAEVVGDRILRALAEPVPFNGRYLTVTASVGLAAAEPGQDVDAVLRHADLAMYDAKHGGKSRLVTYRPDLFTDAEERNLLKSELTAALADEQFVLLFQPIVDLETKQPVSAEALLRWQHPRLGLLAPDRFLHLAEESGVIVPLGRWILHAAAIEVMTWASKDLTISVNISARQLIDPNFVSDVALALARSGLPPARLTLEITESVLIAAPDLARAALMDLRELGVKIALDDFGTGFSSLTHLQFPVDILKIDRSFVSGLGADTGTIAAGILSLAETLGLATIAEGIESEDQAAMLRQRDCRYGQGHLYGKPEPSATLKARWLAEAAAELTNN